MTTGKKDNASFSFTEADLQACQESLKIIDKSIKVVMDDMVAIFRDSTDPEIPPEDAAEICSRAHSMIASLLNVLVNFPAMWILVTGSHAVSKKISLNDVVKRGSMDWAIQSAEVVELSLEHIRSLEQELAKSISVLENLFYSREELTSFSKGLPPENRTVH